MKRVALVLALGMLLAGCFGPDRNEISWKINGRLDNIQAAVEAGDWSAFEAQLGSATTGPWEHVWDVVYEDGKPERYAFSSPTEVSAYVLGTLKAVSMKFLQRKTEVFETESVIFGRMVMEDVDGNLRDASFYASFLRNDWKLVFLRLRFNE